MTSYTAEAFLSTVPQIEKMRLCGSASTVRPTVEEDFCFENCGRWISTVEDIFFKIFHSNFHFSLWKSQLWKLSVIGLPQKFCGRSQSFPNVKNRLERGGVLSLLKSFRYSLWENRVTSTVYE